MYNLIPNLTVKENIEVGAYLSDHPLDINDLLRHWGSMTTATSCRTSSLAVSSSVLQSEELSSKIQAFCSVMSRQVHSITILQKKF